MELSLVFPHLPLYFAELIFGMLYAAIVHWLSTKHYFPGGTAGSVILGDAVTLFVQWVFIHSNWDPFVTFLCFACSGTPMATTYWWRRRMKVEKARHCRRPWPTSALRARDDALMDITSMIERIERAAHDQAITPGFLLTLTNDLHGVKQTLTSV